MASAAGISVVQRKTRQRADTIIGAMWAIGMAFGSILAVPSLDLLIMLVLNLVICALVVLFYIELLAISFDATFATVEKCLWTRSTLSCCA